MSEHEAPLDFGADASPDEFVVTRPKAREYRGPRPALTTKGVAAICAVDSFHIRRAVRSGELRAYNIALGDGQRPVYRFTYEDVRKWLEKRRVCA